MDLDPFAKMGLGIIVPFIFACELGLFMGALR